MGRPFPPEPLGWPQRQPQCLVGIFLKRMMAGGVTAADATLAPRWRPPRAPRDDCTAPATPLRQGCQESVALRPKSVAAPESKLRSSRSKTSRGP